MGEVCKHGPEQWLDEKAQRGHAQDPGPTPASPLPMLPTTNEQLDALQRLTDAATEGPWEANVLGSEGYDVRARRPPTPGRLSRLRIARCGYEEWETDKANAAFIAAAREAVPALIVEVKRLHDGWDEEIARSIREHDRADAAVARETALREAVEALADEWDADENTTYTSGPYADDLRALLTEGGEQA